MPVVRLMAVFAIGLFLASCGAETAAPKVSQSDETIAQAGALRDGASLDKTTAEQADFRQRIKTAYTAEDKIAAIGKLFYLANTDNETQTQYFERSIPMLAREGVGSIAFEPLPDDFHGDYAMEGYRYEPDPSPIGYVALNGTTRAPYGEVDGVYYLVGVKRTLINANPPAEQTVQMIVIGLASPPMKFEGACKVLRSDGKIVEHKIEDSGQGGVTLALNAVRIESCYIQKLSDPGVLSVRIIEGDDTIFEKQISGAEKEIDFVHA